MNSHTIAHSALVQYISRGFAIVFGLVAMAIMTRMLGPEGFGYYSTIVGFLTMVTIVVDFGFILTTTKMVSEYPERRGAVMGTIGGVRILTTVGVLALAPLGALVMAYDSVVQEGMWIAMFSFMAVSIHQIIIGYFQARYMVQWNALAEVGGRVVLITLLAVAWWLGGGLMGAISAVVISSATTLVLGSIALRNVETQRIVFDRTLLPEFWRTTWPVGLSVILNLLYLKTDIVILSLYRGPVEVGIYGAAYRVIDVLTGVPMLFMGVVLPVLTIAWKQRDTQRFHTVAQEALRFLLVVGVPITLGGILVGVPLMRLIAGDDFAPAGVVLGVLLLAQLGLFIGGVFGHTVVAMNAQRTMMWGYGICALLSLAGYIIFIPQYGMWAAAWVSVASELFVAVWSCVLVTTRARLRIETGWLGKLAGASIVMVATLILTQLFPVIVQIVVAACAYATMILVLRVYEVGRIRALLRNTL